MTLQDTTTSSIAVGEEDATLPERFYSDYADLDAKTAAVAKSSLQSLKGTNNNSSMKNIELHKHALEHAAIKLKDRDNRQKRTGRIVFINESWTTMALFLRVWTYFHLDVRNCGAFLDGNSPHFDLLASQIWDWWGRVSKL